MGGVKRRLREDFALTLNNPAGRLHQLLVEAQQIKNNSPIADGWRTLLKIEGKSIADLLERLAPVLRLPHQAKAAVLALENENHNLLLRWLPKVESAFSIINLQAPWEQFKVHLDPTTMYSLEVCGDRLSVRSPEGAIETETLNTILGQTRDLRGEVAAADLDRVLKDFLLRHLGEIEYAIENYRVRGTPGIQQAMRQSVGEIFTRPEVAAKVGQTSFGKRFVAIVLAINTVVSFGGNVARIEERFSQYLLEAPQEEIHEEAPQDSTPQMPPPDTTKKA